MFDYIVQVLKQPIPILSYLLNCLLSHILPYRILLMESQTCFEKFNQSSYRQNLLEAKADASIKRHQVKGFINAGEGASKISIAENDENSQLAEHLMHLKTSCSGVRLEIKHKELEQFKYKDETHFLADKVKAIQDERFQLEAEIQKLKAVVEQVKDKKTNASLSTKSYEHILDRMKKDEIRGQIRRNQLEKELKRLQKAYKQLTNKCYELKEFEYLSASGVKEAEEEIKELNCFRKSTVADMSSILQEKHVLEKKKQDRKEKSDMIKEMAAGDLQDADLIRMKKFLTVQVFLKSMLKSKMEKLKEFYSPYELAFLKIKGNTSVKDAGSLKAEYHNFEVSYNERSSWVKHLEDEISSLEKEKKEMEKEYEQTKMRELEILQSLEQAEKHHITQGNRQLQSKADQCQIVVMSVREWLKHQAKRMKLDSSNKPDSLLLRQICEQLKKKKGEEQK